MKYILTFLVLSMSLTSLGQPSGVPIVGYNVSTIAVMKAYVGSANRIHVDFTNSDYDNNPLLTANEVNVFAGTGGKKWKKVEYQLNADSITSGALSQSRVANLVIDLTNKLGVTDTAKVRAMADSITFDGSKFKKVGNIIGTLNTPDSLNPQFSGAIRINGDTVATKAEVRAASGTGTIDSVRVLSSPPVTGNVYINPLDSTIRYKIGTLWLTMAKGVYYTFINTEASDYFGRLETAGYFAPDNIKMAYDNFVTSAKANDYYSKLKLLNVYLGSADSHRKLNAISSSYTQTWGSGVSFITGAGGGVKGDGTSNGYINTNLVPSTQLTLDDVSIGFWTVESGAQDTYDMGCRSSGVARITVQSRTSADNSYVEFNESSASSGIVASALDASGFWCYNRTSSTSSSLQRNGSVSGTNTAANGGSLPNIAIYIMASNNAGTPIDLSTRTYKMTFVADSMIDTEASDFYTDLSTFLTAIGR